MSFVVVCGKKKNMYLREIGKNQLLAVLVKSGAKWDALQAEIAKASNDLQYIINMKEKL